MLSKSSFLHRIAVSSVILITATDGLSSDNGPVRDWSVELNFVCTTNPGQSPVTVVKNTWNRWAVGDGVPRNTAQATQILDFERVDSGTAGVWIDRNPDTRVLYLGGGAVDHPFSLAIYAEVLDAQGAKVEIEASGRFIDSQTGDRFELRRQWLTCRQ